MSIKGSKKKNSQPLKIGNNLTIEQTPDLVIQLKDVITSKSSIMIESETIENIDQSGIQFLLELLKHKEEIGDLSLPFSDNTTDLLTKCGFSKHFNL